MVQTGKMVKSGDLVKALKERVDGTGCIDIEACLEFIYVHVRRRSSAQTQQQIARCRLAAL
jgi:hypothetical protein